MESDLIICQGDCLVVMKDIPDNSIDAVVTDPPYLLEFMGKKWDSKPAHEHLDWHKAWATECLRVLKPGGHLLSFGGTRTWHRLAVAVEDAGFEIRDSIAWLYGQGFPKSMDISKAIDKANGRVGDKVIELKHALREAFAKSGLKQSEVDARCGFRAANYLTLPAEGKRFDPWVGILPTAEKWAVMADVLGCHDLDGLFDSAEREVTQHAKRPAVMGETISFDQRSSAERERRDIPATPEAGRWSGWGTALKPAFEPVIVARKPLIGTLAANVLAHGTGGLNIDGCRVHSGPSEGGSISGRRDDGIGYAMGAGHPIDRSMAAGRWPTNVVLDEHMAAELDAQTGTLKSGKAAPGGHTRSQPPGEGIYGGGKGLWTEAGDAGTLYGDSGGASRFFPRFPSREGEASADRRYTDEGGTNFAMKPGERRPAAEGPSEFFPTFKYQSKAPKKERPVLTKDDGTRVMHPTVKPVELMRWLIRLVAPEGGIVLDPFAGSGTTGEAARLEGMSAILIEKEDDYHALMKARLG